MNAIQRHSIVTIPSWIFIVSLLIAGFSGVPIQAALTVTSTSPVAQSIDVLPADPILIRFNSQVALSSVDSASVRIFGRWSGPASYTATVFNDNGAITLSLQPTQPFFSGEWVTVNLSHTIQNTSGDSLLGGYAFNFWTKTLPGALDLVETKRISARLPGELHVQTYGAYAGDLNDDGWTDLAAPNEISNDVRVFLNDGAGGYSGFTIVPMPGSLSPSANEGADFDLDGKIDLAVGSGGNDKLTVMLGDGLGGFVTPNNYTASSSVRGVAVIDLNSDGFDDLVTANRNGSNLALFINDKTGSFLAPTFVEAGGFGETAVATADANNDGIQDIFVGAISSQEFILLLGDGAGSLTVSSTISAGGRPWMITVGDVNNDGNVDVVSANSTSNNVSVSFGNGAGGLSPVATYPSGAFSIAIDLGDLDGDGDLDMVSSNFSGNNWNVYENLGFGVFGNVRSYPASSTGSCAILHDRDNDGDLDMTGVDETDDLLFLFDNVFNGVWFAADTVIGEAPLSVSFTGITNRSATSWSWDFGDGGASVLQSPSHTFTNPGQYQISVEIQTPEGPLTTVESKFVGVFADSVLPAEAFASAGELARVDIYVRNYLDLNLLRIPLSWTGNLDISFVFASTSGLRSEFMTADFTSIDPTNHRVLYTLFAPPDSFLPAGSGPILSLFFLVSSGAGIDSTLVTVGTNPIGDLQFDSPLGSYTPDGGSAAVRRACCVTPGDYNHDGGFNIADVVDGIARIFSGGPAPACQDEADADGNNQFNIADVMRMIGRIMGGLGAAPECGTTGS